MTRAGAEHGPGRSGAPPVRATTTSRAVGRAAALAGAILAAALLLGSCGEEGPSTLAPDGPRAQRVADLWWIMLAIAAAVFAVVIGLLFVALFRPRRDDDRESAGPPGGVRFVVVGGIVVPALILLGVFALAVGAMRALEDPSAPPAFEVEVLGHQWWWEIRYPDQDVVTANEIHIPVGEPVRVKLTAEGVIHSFWVPQLSGKLDLTPGKVNEFWLEADVPGVYLGECAEFCGIQHAKMAFRVVAEPDEIFALWLDRMRAPAAAPDNEIIQRGQDVFLSSACVTCHTVRGTAATGDLGPDLTHIGSRRTLAAGTLENTRANLAAWVVAPQTFKPGSYMPPTNLTGEELQAVVTYLESLE